VLLVVIGLRAIVGTKARKPNEFVVKKVIKIPTNRLVTRMDVGLDAEIVIPVVVGSSPISHPNVYMETPLFKR
jgi:hypothetical protein